MPDAARVGDATEHGTPLGPGPGSPDVKIGYMPAWRAVPSSMASAIDGASNAMKSFMDKPQLTPADATGPLADISAKMGEVGGAAAGEGSPGTAGAAGAGSAATNTTNATLTTTWTSASAAPGGQPAANVAYTEGIKAAAAGAAAGTFSSMAGVADMHVCPTPSPVPPHGPGFVTKGSTTVMINGLPACRKGDKVMEACGGADGIAAGCPTVNIDDSGGGGGGGGGGGSGAGGGPGALAEGADQSVYSDEPAEEPPPGESEQTVDQGNHYLELELVDMANEPVPGEPFKVTLPDGREVPGATDKLGQAKLLGIKKPGQCQICFTKLDVAAWEVWTGTSPPPAAPGGSGAPREVSADPVEPDGPLGPGPDGTWRRVRSGECMSSIARDAGHFWEVLWNHAKNAKLQTARQDANVLMPGDAVFIPKIQTKQEPGATDAHHKFQRKGEPSKLRLIAKADGKPMANEPYVIVIDGKKREGKTDAEGRVEINIPGNARRGRLTVGKDEEHQRVFILKLGGLDPINTLAGIQARLNNLGFVCGNARGKWDEKTEAAIKAFQAKYKLNETGQATPETQAKLKEVHGF